MGNYILRRLLIAVPSLLGISIVLFTVLALAPGDPFEELATNPNVPAEVRMMLRAQFGLDDPVWQRYLHWLASMLQGDWGFCFVSRVDVDQLILQRLPVTIVVIGAVAGAGAAGGAAGGRAGRRQALFLVRPHRQHAGLHRLFAADLLHRRSLFILFFRINLDWLPFVFRADISATGWAVVVGALQAEHHAGVGAGPVPGGQLDALRALVRCST